MGIPFTTTKTKHERWSLDTPGTLVTVLASNPAVVGNVSGKEIWADKQAGGSGWKEQLDAKLNCDFQDVRYNDIITDLGTGNKYRVASSMLRQGFGLDHVEALMSDYAPTGLYSLFRGTNEDEYGDEVPDAVDALWADVAGILEEVSRNTETPASQTPNTARRYSGRFPVGMDIQPRDRITNQDTGVTYVVEAVGAVSEPGPADVGLELTRITE